MLRRSLPWFIFLFTCCAADAGAEPELDVGGTAQALLDTKTWSNNGDSAVATCTVFTWGERIADDHAQIDCDISDTEGDSHSVYVEWSQDGFGAIRLTNSDGVGSTVHRSDARVNGDGSFGTIRWKVCTDVQFGGDNCSDTQAYNLRP